jgi:hypothetical protein
MVKGQKFALTSDHWTSTGGITYLGITLSFINKDWKLVNLTLSCTVHSGRTTAAACKKEIMAVLQLYDLNISDADTENTMTLLAKIIDGDHHYCIAHVLELTTVSAKFILSILTLLHLWCFDVISFYLMPNPETELRWILRCLQTSKTPRGNHIPFHPLIRAFEKGSASE